MLKKFVLISYVFFVAVVALLVVAFFVQERRIIEAREEHVQSFANHAAEKVNVFLQDKKEKAEFLATLDVFIALVTNPDSAVALDEVNKTITIYQGLLPGIGLLNKEGIILASDHLPIGTDYSVLPVFPIDNETKTFFTRYYDPTRKADYYAVGSIIYDPQNPSEAIGVVGFDVALDAISDLIADIRHAQAHGHEIFLTDSSGLLLSRSSYIGVDNKGGVLIQEVGDFALEECLEDLDIYAKGGLVEEHEEELQVYLNYMGDEVLGAHAYAPDISGCVVAQEHTVETLDTRIMNFFNNLFEKGFYNEKYN